MCVVFTTAGSLESIFYQGPKSHRNMRKNNRHSTFWSSNISDIQGKIIFSSMKSQLCGNGCSLIDRHAGPHMYTILRQRTRSHNSLQSREIPLNPQFTSTVVTSTQHSHPASAITLDPDLIQCAIGLLSLPLGRGGCLGITPSIQLPRTAVVTAYTFPEKDGDFLNRKVKVLWGGPGKELKKGVSRWFHGRVEKVRIANSKTIKVCYHDKEKHWESRDDVHCTP